MDTAAEGPVEVEVGSGDGADQLTIYPGPQLSLLSSCLEPATYLGSAQEDLALASP